MNDVFSNFCTGLHITDEARHRQYEQTKGYEFDRILAEQPGVSMVDIDEKSGVVTCVCHTPDAAWGFFKYDMGILKPLDRLTSQSETRHLMSISTREDWRKCGFWSLAMEIILDAAEQAGILLHGISRPFVMNWPKIEDSEQMMWFLRNDEKFFSYLSNMKEQKRQSKQLLRKYQSVGCCRFKYPPGNGISTAFRRNNFGFAYMSSNASDTIRRTFEPHLNCSTTTAPTFAA